MTDQDLHRDYAEAGFGNRLGFGRRPALIVVDFVQAYLEKSSPVYAGVEDVLTVTKRVLEAARRANILRIFTVARYQDGCFDAGVFNRKVDVLNLFQAGSPMGEIVPDLEPVDGELVITKQYPSGFFGTSMGSVMTANGIDTAIITGLSTSGCVRATVVDALSHGFIPIVVEDAVGDRDARPHAANLFDMQAKYADVLPAEQVIEWLTKEYLAGSAVRV